MSTRATILVTYKAGNTIQLYHHCDGYPEYMGKLLESFCQTSHFLPSDIDTSFYNLLKMEKYFEFENKGLRHGDIEYCWYVTLSEEGYEISYTEINPLLDEIYKIENDDEYEKAYDKMFEDFLTAKKGTKLYA